MQAAESSAVVDCIHCALSQRCFQLNQAESFGASGQQRCSSRWFTRRIPPTPQDADDDGSGELDIEEFVDKLGPYLGKDLSELEI